MNKKPFGLDIGASSIRVVSVEKKGESYVLNSSASIPAPSRGIFSAFPLDQEEMAGTIQKVVSLANIDAKNVNIAASDNKVYTKVLEMPILSDQELRSAIYWEAEQYIPLPLSEISLTWQVLDKPKQVSQGEKMLVLMVGAPTSTIEKYQKVLSTAGFTIDSMETEILSTIRSLCHGSPFPTSIILNIGEESTSFAVVKDNIIAFTYSMSTGGSAIDRAIATDFGFTKEQAEEYKKTYGLSDKIFGGKIGQATTPVLNTIASEVKKSIAYFSQKYPNSQIRQIILSGGSANLPGIDAYFANNVGVETVIGNPWNILSSKELPKELLVNASSYSVAVGLAMKSYE